MLQDNKRDVIKYFVSPDMRLHIIYDRFRNTFC